MNDPVLIARLRDYIRETHGGRAQIDIGTVVSDLREIYPEYGRRSMSAFRQRVVGAYGILQQNKQQQQQTPLNGSMTNVTGTPKSDSMNITNNVNQSPMVTASPAEGERKTKATKNGMATPGDSSVRPAKVRRRRTSEAGELPPSFSEIVKPAVIASLRLEDLGGLDHIKADIDRILRHMRNAELLRKIGAEPCRGLLLHGPPGCGKTSLAIALAGELGLPLLQTAGPELVAGISGQSEAQLRSLFKAAATRHKTTGCCLFIDELDVVAGRRESASRDLERRLVSQLLLCIDSMPSNVLLIGATSRPDALDPGLRRTGRFDREVGLGQPSETERADILRVLTRTVPIDSSVDLLSVARITPGYVASDLKALINAAAGIAVERYCDGNGGAMVLSSTPAKEAPESNESDILIAVDAENAIDVDVDPVAASLNASIVDLTEADVKQPETPQIKIEYSDFMAAVRFVQPSAKREGFATVPEVNWADVGALEAVRYELFMAVVAPLHRPDIFVKLGLRGSPGILLFGPPGCGKTLLAKAVANESGLNFVAVNGPELLNMYVGESERAVRQVFARARASSPCLVFFDELDSLCPVRSNSSASSGSDASSRVVNQMLCELDGVQSRPAQVFVLAATNRPDMVDPAVLRPGRFDKLLYVGLPSEAGRFDVLKALTKNGTRPKVKEGIEALERVARAADGFTGADLAALVREAAVIAAGPLLSSVAASSGCVAKSDPPSSSAASNNDCCDPIEESTSLIGDVDVFVEFSHFEQALNRCHRSVKPEDLRRYERLCQRYTVAEPVKFEFPKKMDVLNNNNNSDSSKPAIDGGNNTST